MEKTGLAAKSTLSAKKEASSSKNTTSGKKRLSKRTRYAKSVRHGLLVREMGYTTKKGERVYYLWTNGIGLLFAGRVIAGPTITLRKPTLKAG